MPQRPDPERAAWASAAVRRSAAATNLLVAGRAVRVLGGDPRDAAALAGLLTALGARNVTPDKFSEAIEEETDVPVDVLQETLSLFTQKQVRALVYNEQTTGPQTEQVLAAAKDNGIAVVPVTETLPEGKDYTTWMTENVDAIAAALAR